MSAAVLPQTQRSTVPPMNRPLIAAFILGVLATACQGTSVTSPSSMEEVTAQPSAASQTESTPPSPSESLTQTVSARPSPSQTVSASPSPSAAPEPGLAIFASAVNGLRLRAGPSLTAHALEYRCTGNFVEVPADCSEAIVIDAGRTMVVFDGPVAADGFDWYLVVLTGREPGADQLGWAATPQDGDAWLVPSRYECPASAPDVNVIVAMGGAAAVHCYQGRELTLEGWVATGFGCNQMGTFEPTWLAHPCANMSYIRSTPPPPMGDQPLFLHYPAPGVINPTLTYDDTQRVWIVGHYDDPVATECVIEPADPPREDGRMFVASDLAADVAECRMRFVVTEVTALP